MTPEERPSVEFEIKRLESLPARSGWQTLNLATLRFQLREEQQAK